MRCNLFVSFSYVPVCYLPYDMRGMYHVSNITMRRKTPQFNHLGYVYTGPVRNGSGPIFGPDRPSVYTGRPERIQNWTCCFAGPVSDPIRTGSRMVPCKHLDRFQTVPCKQKPIRFGTVPDRFRVNVALKCL